MGNQKLYQPTAEELDALWEKGNRRDMPCDNPGCVPCMQLHGRRLAALNQILKHAQQLQAQSQSPSVFVGSGRCLEMNLTHQHVPSLDHNLNKGCQHRRVNRTSVDDASGTTEKMHCLDCGEFVESRYFSGKRAIDFADRQSVWRHNL